MSEIKTRAEGHLSLRLDIRIVEELDAVAAQMQADSPGLRITRADVARVYLLDGMARAKRSGAGGTAVNTTTVVAPAASGAAQADVETPVQASAGVKAVVPTTGATVYEAETPNSDEVPSA